MEEFLKKIGGVDKLLHFLVGAVISFTITSLMILQDGISVNISGNTTLLCVGFTGFFIAAIAGLIKEIIVDGNFDWKDFVATLIGGFVPIVVNAIGILLYFGSN